MEVILPGPWYIFFHSRHAAHLRRRLSWRLLPGGVGWTQALLSDKPAFESQFYHLLFSCVISAKALVASAWPSVKWGWYCLRCRSVMWVWTNSGEPHGTWEIVKQWEVLLRSWPASCSLWHVRTDSSISGSRPDGRAWGACVPCWGFGVSKNAFTWPIKGQLRPHGKRHAVAECTVSGSRQTR